MGGLRVMLQDRVCPRAQAQGGWDLQPLFLGRRGTVCVCLCCVLSLFLVSTPEVPIMTPTCARKRMEPLYPWGIDHLQGVFLEARLG